MSSINTISAEKLARLTGTPKCPALIDVRIDEDFKGDPRFIPGAVQRPYESVREWATEFSARAAVAICHNGQKLSQEVAAWLRQAGAISADSLESGHQAWVDSGLPVVPAGKLPPRDPKGRTVWVTRARAKIDRIACPWLIRRFVDPAAIFLFISPVEVMGVAERFGGTAFDIEDVYWSHRDDRCTFDIMIEPWGLEIGPLRRLALIVRAADTARFDLASEAPGLLAASLGLSRLYSDDLEQLEAGLALYDAFYRWCRDATGETHNWPVKSLAKTTPVSRSIATAREFTNWPAKKPGA
jgi:rhodanese-related sulfurtransferase